MRKKSRCAICNAKFHNPGIFPKDFPIEWRWCCNCSGIAAMITRSNFARVCNTLAGPLFSNSFLKRAKKINELISVV